MPSPNKDRRFSWLFGAVVLLLVTYPYFGEGARGAVLGQLMALTVVLSGVHSVRANRLVRGIGGVLALFAATTSVIALITETRGNVWTEAAFTIFYLYITVAVFAEIVRIRDYTLDTILGALCIYLMIGLTFGSLYDWLETVRPASFVIHDTAVGMAHLGFRQLLFYSFMTLTTVGYGDISPVTTQAQSFAIIEGVVGVFYVAVLIARMINAYERYERWLVRGGPV